MNSIFSFDEKDLDYTILNNENRKFCEMSEFDIAFLCGILKKYKPLNILEIGVSAGATSAIILELIKKYDLPLSLTSVDKNSDWYRDNQLRTGFRVKALHGANIQHQLFTGNYLPEIIENLNMKFDLCILDTVHSLPGELLDFLAVMPFMNNNGIIVLHDIHLYFKNSSHAYATKLIFDSCVGQKLMARDLSNLNVLPNIGAVIIGSDTQKYIKDCFRLFSMKWEYQLKDSEFKIYYDFFLKYYPKEFSEYFSLARNANVVDKEKTINDKSYMRFTLLKNYIKLLKRISSYNFDIDIIYDTKDYVWASIPISDDKNIHYEFLFFKNGIKICLHFAAMQKNNFIGRFVNELQIDLYENETKSTKEIYFYIDNIYDIEYISSIMNYLIKKTIPLLLNKHYISHKLVLEIYK